jgi:hypothetical protein
MTYKDNGRQGFWDEPILAIGGVTFGIIGILREIFQEEVRKTLEECDSNPGDDLSIYKWRNNTWNWRSILWYVI